MIPITNDGASYSESTPHWTKDGSQVIFSGDPVERSGQRRHLHQERERQRLITAVLPVDRNDIFPVLSPDGRYIAFASNPDGAYDIYIFDQNDGTLSQLTNTTTDEYPGDWWQQ